ncbi:MAG: DUF61 family protein [Thermoplasmata archaeon]
MPLDTEGSLKKLMQIEYRNINAGIVTRRRKLRDLLQEDDPSCKARDGSSYRFDREYLNEFANLLTEEERGSLRLPITLTFDVKLPDHCYITDELASTILRRLENFGPAYQYQEGKMWMPASIGLHLIRKYGHIIQRLFLP